LNSHVQGALLPELEGLLGVREAAEMGDVVQDAHGSVCQAVLRGYEQLTEKQLLVVVL
jgi:hypothetical protein